MNACIPDIVKELFRFSLSAVRVRSILRGMVGREASYMEFGREVVVA
jgi:hypothetical protein